MKKTIINILFLCITLFSMSLVNATPNLEINTPAINALKSSMQKRHGQLATHYNSGAIGLTTTGLIAVRNVKAVPLKDRQGINGLVAAENNDRNKLYKEIAVANNHPEWESGIRNSFAVRWVDKAKGGWYYQKSGGWVKK